MAAHVAVMSSERTHSMITLPAVRKCPCEISAMRLPLCELETARATTITTTTVTTTTTTTTAANTITTTTTTALPPKPTATASVQPEHFP